MTAYQSSNGSAKINFTLLFVNDLTFINSWEHISFQDLTIVEQDFHDTNSSRILQSLGCTTNLGIGFLESQHYTIINRSASTKEAEHHQKQNYSCSIIEVSGRSYFTFVVGHCSWNSIFKMYSKQDERSSTNYRPTYCMSSFPQEKIGALHMNNLGTNGASPLGGHRRDPVDDVDVVFALY